jgi:Putative Actinobacterial Holin-X, holin superfamily III
MAARAGVSQTLLDAVRGLITQSEVVARAEARAAASRATDVAAAGARRVAVLGVAVLLGCYALGFALLSAYLALEPHMAPWIAALAVAAGVLVLAGGIAWVGARSPVTVEIDSLLTSGTSDLQRTHESTNSATGAARDDRARATVRSVRFPGG